jgi:hypothetical protein
MRFDQDDDYDDQLDEDFGVDLAPLPNDDEDEWEDDYDTEHATWKTRTPRTSGPFWRRQKEK